MKQNEIEPLLEKLRSGTLTDDELAHLNALSRRDEVLTNAERRADAIVRRRRGYAMAFSAMAAIGIGAVLLTAPQRNEPVQLAIQTLPVATKNEPAAQPVAAAELQAEPVQMASAKPAATKRKPATLKTPAKNDTPVVVCNSQCDADSVISDIWKFLSA